MQSIQSSFLIIHVVAGFSALFMFWIPVLLRKGSIWHSRVGWYYVYAMWVVVITTLILCTIRFYQHDYVMAMFLSYLALITANPLYYAVAILKQRTGYSSRFSMTYRFMHLLLGIYAVIMVLSGIFWVDQGTRILMIFFGMLGINGIRDAFYMTSVKKQNRIENHRSGLIITGIAAYTAFLAFGGRTFFPPDLPTIIQVAFWVLPTIVGIAWLRLTKSPASSGQIKS